MEQHKLHKLGNGAVASTSVPTQPRGPTSSTGSLLVRGCVVASYPLGGSVALSLPANETQKGVYVDVLLYTGIPGMKANLLQRCLVPVGRGGVHDNKPWIPRAATRNLATGEVFTMSSINKFGDPANLDGDHVLVGFIDGDLGLPIVLQGLPHPRAQLKARTYHGESEVLYHRGVQFGVDAQGNVVIDARDAHPGSYDAQMQPVAPPDNNECGNVEIRAQGRWSLEGNQTSLHGTAEGEVALRGGSSDTHCSVQFDASQVATFARRTTTNTSMLSLTSTGVRIEAGRDDSLSPVEYMGTVTIDANDLTSTLAGNLALTVSGSTTLDSTGNVQLLSDGTVTIGAADQAALLGTDLVTAVNTASNTAATALATVVDPNPAAPAAAATLAWIQAFTSALQAALSQSVTLKR